MTRMQTTTKLATATLAALILFVGSAAALPLGAQLTTPLGDTHANAHPTGIDACTQLGASGLPAVPVPAVPVAPAVALPAVSGAADACVSAGPDGLHANACAASDIPTAIGAAEMAKGTALGAAGSLPVAAPALPVGTDDVPRISGDVCADAQAGAEGVEAEAGGSFLDQVKGAVSGLISKIGGLF